LAKLLFEGNPNRSFAIIDATYIPIEKSQNYAAARKSWSQHKGYRLLKMMIVCGSDGYILGVHGPYFSDGKNNDEAIFKAITGVHDDGFRNFFEEGDMIIWDRGFRYVNELANSMGFEVKMPHFTTMMMNISLKLLKLVQRGQIHFRQLLRTIKWIPGL
jgi:DDE superfamily endonuclease